MNLLAVISIVVCWSAFALTWLFAAIYYEARAPEERTRSWLGSAMPAGLLIALMVWVAVPKADWSSLGIHAPWIRLLGLAILLASTALTLRATCIRTNAGSSVPAGREILPISAILPIERG